MQRIFTFVRFDIKNEKNIEVIHIIFQNMNSTNSILVNALKGHFYNMDQLLFEDGDIIENYEITGFMKDMLAELENSLMQGTYAYSYDIIDLIHFLPELIISNNKKQIKSFWKTNAKNFMEKWGQN